MNKNIQKYLTLFLSFGLLFSGLTVFPVSVDASSDSNYVEIEPLCTGFTNVIGAGNATIWAHSGSGAISIGSAAPGTSATLMGNAANGRTRVRVRATSGNTIIGYIASNRLNPVVIWAC